MDKRNRIYKFIHIAQDKTQTIVEPPFTIEFDIDRKAYGVQNLGSIRLYNISKEKRERMRKDQIHWSLDQKIILAAGYEGNLSIILNMSVSQCWSVREGVDFITQLQCLDGGFSYVNAQLLGDLTFGDNEKQRDAILKIAKTLDFKDPLTGETANGAIGTGAVGNFDGDFDRGLPTTGSPYKLLDELTGGAYFVDNSIINFLKDDEAIGGDDIVITPESGLLETPIRENYSITFKMLFEPSIHPGKIVQLKSFTGDQNVNGRYKVRALHHRGMISDAVCGVAITEVECWKNDFLEILADIR